MMSLSYLFVLTVTLLLSPSLSWNLPLRRTKAVPKPTDSRLFYTNGEDTLLDTTDGLFASSTVIVPETAATAVPVAAIPLSSSSSSNALQQQPRAMDLPKHSPPREVLQRQKILLQSELLVGRVAMVAALCLFVNEFFTGNSMMDQLTGLFR